MINLIERLSQFRDKTAIIDANGEYSYSDLLSSSSKVAAHLLRDNESLNETRAAFIVPPSFEYVAVLLGIWRAGGIAVPLCVSHPDPELDYVISQSGAEMVIAHTQFEERLRVLADNNNARFSAMDEVFRSTIRDLPDIDESARAMIVYTSGTTSRPKGVVTTHANIRAQIVSLIEAWGWTDRDYILNVLPLHHVHGIVNILLCALWSGAKCEMMPRFDADTVWKEFIDRDFTLFMAVPTIYSRLIRAWEEASAEEKDKMTHACGSMRLMVSGSAALPVGTLERWQQISGHVLLERYGMTEIGMALSNPLGGKRVPGHVGKPLPGVQIRLKSDKDEEQGEILVKGSNVFLEYWVNPEATASAFTEDGWFKTGDIACVNEEGVYKILGRDSVDIIKSGGYKISALEIEEVLRTDPTIADCAVVGVPDSEWGERVCAALVSAPEADLNLDSLRLWCKDRLAPYKVPSEMLLVPDLPRNALGKVLKPKVVELFSSEK